MPSIGGIPVTACIAEFVGTFLLIFTVGCNVLSGNGTFGAVSIACVLMVSIYAFGGASGGHFNPAVTLALQLARKLEKTGGWTQVAVYVIFQICGGLAAGFSYGLLFENAFPLAPKAGFTIGAVISELLYSFMLCFVVLNTAASKAKGGKNQYFGLAIGFVIIAGGFGAGALGAGCFNPAVALSIHASSLLFKMGGSGVYLCALVAAELVGAVIAVALFQVVRPEEKSVPSADVGAPDLKAKLISEAIGTYMLVATVGLNVLGSSPAGAFSIAASLTCMIYALGDISGGHFNPAVTLAIFLSGKGKDTVTDCCKYAAAQLLGGILAALTYAFAHNGATFPLGPGTGHTWSNVVVAEATFTFVLTFVVLAVAVVEKQPAPEFVGLIIGSTVTAGGFAIGGVSGGCLNPAVSVGIAFAQILGGGYFFKALAYTVCQLAGAIVAAKVFRILYLRAQPLFETASKDWLKICLAEFIGTFLLVLTVGCNVLTKNGNWGAVSIACVLMVSIYAFAEASGAHLNPAVTMALAFAGKLNNGTSVAKQVLSYSCSQLSGGMCAAITYHLLFARGFDLAPKEGHVVGANLCEVLFTFMLCFVVLNAAASKAKSGANQYYGLAIGFVIIAGGFAAGPLGAGCFNPAVAVSIFAGADFQNQASELAAAGHCLAFVLMEVVGAGLAAFLFSVVRQEEQDASRQPDPDGYSLTSKLISEFIGTFMLVFTVGLNVLGGSPAAALSIAAALTCMIYAIGDVSGGHFNPAVTLAIQACGKGEPNHKEAALYMLAQIAGGVVAAFAYSLAYNGATFPLGPGAGHSWESVAIAEIVFTFVLASVVLCTAVVDKKPAEEFIGFLIGSCVTVGGFAIGGISGGCLNPAVAIGIASSHILGGGLFYKALLYSALDLAGGAGAAVMFRSLYGERQSKMAEAGQA